MNLFTKQKQTHRHRKQTWGYHRGRVGGGINSEYGTNRYTLSYIKQINNKGLLYSTGNYIQYLAVAYNGKVLGKKKNIIYIKLNHCCTSKTYTIL